jgi:hypothetical protein
VVVITDVLIIAVVITDVLTIAVVITVLLDVTVEILVVDLTILGFGCLSYFSYKINSLSCNKDFKVTI